MDDGSRPGLPSDVAEKMKALEPENRELRQTNEILRKASAYLAQSARSDFGQLAERCENTAWRIDPRSARS